MLSAIEEVLGKFELGTKVHVINANCFTTRVSIYKLTIVMLTPSRFGVGFRFLFIPSTKYPFEFAVITHQLKGEIFAVRRLGFHTFIIQKL